MSIIEAATKAMLLKKIKKAKWKQEVSTNKQEEYSINGKAWFVGFNAYGYIKDSDTKNSDTWAWAFFEDRADNDDNIENNLLETTIEGEYKEEVLFKAQEWLLANVDKAVEMWAKKYNPSQQKTAKGNQ